MFRVIDSAWGNRGIPIRSWAEDLDDETLGQLRRIARAPYVRHFVCAMADAHLSEHVAVGSVFAAERTVVPSALGGDLGCGMLAVPLVDDAGAAFDTGGVGPVERRRLLERWLASIPVGKALRRHPLPFASELGPALFQAQLSTRSLEKTREALVARHIGTLGGGNHFVELGCDAERRAWLLVHSGSRGLGAAIADHHRGAEGAPLEGLSTTHGSGEAYLGDLGWALDFARANRMHIACVATRALEELLGRPVAHGPPVDVHHNFVAEETWFGERLLVHRKGAIAAPAGALALVPGSMGTASYLVAGRGCEAAFGSCSHGAGRVLRRSEARRKIRPEALRRALGDVVIPDGDAMVEEAPAAYRDIRRVLEAQEDLVERRLRLEPLVVLKG